jgi:hypothetical protein
VRLLEPPLLGIEVFGSLPRPFIRRKEVVAPPRTSARDGLAHPIGLLVQCAGLLLSSRMWPNTSATLMAGCAPNSEM